MPPVPTTLPRRASLPTTAPVLADLDGLFRGFADPVRIRVLNLLVAGELCVCDLVEILGLPQSTVSRHLARLRRAGLVEVDHRWRFSHYRLAEPGGPVHRNLVACLRTCFRGISQLDTERARAEARVRQRDENPC